MENLSSCSDSKTPDPKTSETSSTTDASKKAAKPDDQSTSKKRNFVDLSPQ